MVVHGGVGEALEDVIAQTGGSHALRLDHRIGNGFAHKLRVDISHIEVVLLRVIKKVIVFNESECHPFLLLITYHIRVEWRRNAL